jgi:hypothetical protein
MDAAKAVAKRPPRKAANTERHRVTLNSLVRYTFAIYTTTPLDPASRRQLEKSIDSAELSTGRSKLAPKTYFHNRSLRDVYDYHVRLCHEDDTIHPLYLNVADSFNPPDFGVLVVLPNSSTDEDDGIGVAR